MINKNMRRALYPKKKNKFFLILPHCTLQFYFPHIDITQILIEKTTNIVRDKQYFGKKIYMYVVMSERKTF